MNDAIKVDKKGKPWRLIENDYFTGTVPVEVEKSEPYMNWNGKAKISMETWQQILSFFHWSYEEHGSEVQVRLFYHEETDEWSAWAFPQSYGSAGMTTKEISGDEFNDQRALLGNCVCAGSVHHHCSTSAFQSGTDEKDEENQDGLHITVGHMDRPKYDLHSRVSFDKEMYECDLDSWFEYPEEWNDLLDDEIIPYALEKKLCQPAKDVPFPDKWKENVTKEKPAFYRTYSHNRSVGYETHPAATKTKSVINPSSNAVTEKLKDVRTYVNIDESVTKKIFPYIQKIAAEQELMGADIAQWYDMISCADLFIDLCDLIKEHKIDEHDFEQLCYDMDDCISSLEKDDVLYTETEFDYDKEITHQQWLPH